MRRRRLLQIPPPWWRLPGSWCFFRSPDPCCRYSAEATGRYPLACSLRSETPSLRIPLLPVRDRVQKLPCFLPFVFSYAGCPLVLGRSDFKIVDHGTCTVGHGKLLDTPFFRFPAHRPTESGDSALHRDFDVVGVGGKV